MVMVTAWLEYVQLYMRISAPFLKNLRLLGRPILERQHKTTLSPSTTGEGGALRMMAPSTGQILQKDCFSLLHNIDSIPTAPILYHSAWDSQLTVMLTALLRLLAPSHQYNPSLPLVAVSVHASGLRAPVHQSVSFCTRFLTFWAAEKCMSIQPEELVWDGGQRMVKRSPPKNCWLLGVTVGE